MAMLKNQTSNDIRRVPLPETQGCDEKTETAHGPWSANLFPLFEIPKNNYVPSGK
jgi:hypothetical protein